ncbi:uncharacterized protein TM35_000131340 [Trypanosoma theileri]|uniref:Uncharacterized protein n=1 Tax=Trypanosoma theileri TaxID=67003 RepID=A0A1X0NY86_9TRYP|nr:uncharacterized protein TM35_000131340 [Trypanosoma theileri]ORC89130.1 hypothetical protein TM35_000131340 [Trypanosoma theileri]
MNPITSLFTRRSLNRWRIVELVLTGLTAVAASLLIVFVPAARVYCGMALTLSVIIVLRLWRLLPSDRRRVWRESHKLADKMLRERQGTTIAATTPAADVEMRPLVAQSMQPAATMQFSAISPSQQILMGSMLSPQQQQAMIAASVLSQLQQQQQQSILAASMIPQLQQAMMAASIMPQYQQQQQQLQSMMAASMMPQYQQQQQQPMMAASMMPPYQQQQQQQLQSMMAASMMPQYQQQQQQPMMAASMMPQYQQQQQQPMMAPMSSQSQRNYIGSHVSQMVAPDVGGEGNVLPKPFVNVKPTMQFG